MNSAFDKWWERCSVNSDYYISSYNYESMKEAARMGWNASKRNSRKRKKDTK